MCIRDSLKDWIVAQEEFSQDYGNKSVHVTETQHTPHDSEAPAEDDEEDEELDPEIMALMTPAEILAFAQNRAARGKWSVAGRGRTFARKKDGPGNQARRETGPGQQRARKCVNCGKEGHLAADCRGPKRELGQRPCFICGKTGHIARDCKEPKTPGPRAAHVAETGQASLPCLLYTSPSPRDRTRSRMPSSA